MSRCSIWSSTKNSLNFLFSNYLPLSIMITQGRSYLQIMDFQTKDSIQTLINWTTGSTSIHFIKQSTTTKKNFVVERLVERAPRYQFPIVQRAMEKSERSSRWWADAELGHAVDKSHKPIHIRRYLFILLANSSLTEVFCKPRPDLQDDCCIFPHALLTRCNPPPTKADILAKKKRRIFCEVSHQ